MMTFLVMFLLDMAALAVSALAGILAMPLGGLYGAVFVGATVFVLTWRTVGNSRKAWTKFYTADKVGKDKGAQQPRYP